jgi:hypothetical protein
MKLLIYIYLISLFQVNPNTENELAIQKYYRIQCSETGCNGIYDGPEFVNGEDIAHQFSNKMSASVGNKLKQLYQKKKYRKVDFSKITMSTKGMGSGRVVYTLEIPFASVKSKCEAFTSFDHVGGWNHKPDLAKRKTELREVTLAGNQLNISDLKITPEGLQEYWIQWKNENVQRECE